jgi:hypothetical protein
MNVKIELLKDISFCDDTMYHLSFKKGERFESDEPEQGLNEDGTFSICAGMDIYHTIEKDCFKIIDTH